MNKIRLTTASPPWGLPTFAVETTGGVAGSLDGGHSLCLTVLASGQTPTKSLGATFLTTFVFLISRIIYLKKKKDYYMFMIMNTKHLKDYKEIM